MWRSLAPHFRKPAKRIARHAVALPGQQAISAPAFHDPTAAVKKSVRCRTSMSAYAAARPHPGVGNPGPGEVAGHPAATRPRCRIEQRRQRFRIGRFAACRRRSRGRSAFSTSALFRCSPATTMPSAAQAVRTMLTRANRLLKSAEAGRATHLRGTRWAGQSPVQRDAGREIGIRSPEGVLTQE